MSANRQEQKKALLLGMFFSRKYTNPARGQGFRDGVRCQALEGCGYDVRSLDNKHDCDDEEEKKHCKANFSDARRMLQSISDTWGTDCTFDYIILDYFFSPVGWARERWTANFFKETIPMLMESGILAPGGEFWMPYIDCVQESIDDFSNVLSRYYTWGTVEDCMKNPLYAASENVERELLTCPDALTNETQVRPLLKYSNTPFIVFRPRDAVLPSANTTPKSAAASGSGSMSPTKHRRTEAAATVARNLAKSDADLSPSPKKNKRGGASPAKKSPVRARASAN